MQKREIFCSLFVALLLISNILVVKIIAFGNLILPAAIIVYPFCYILSHVVTEIWGFAYARKMIFLGFAANFMMVAFIYLGLLLPAADFWPDQEAFKAIFGLVPRVVAASFVAYLFGELLNSLLMSKIKQKWGPRRLFVRTISSTAVGQAFDTGIFITLAFWGTMSNAELLTLMLGQYIVKLLIEMAVGTPMAYALVGYLKGKGSLSVEEPAETASVALEAVQKSEMTVPVIQLPVTTVIDEKSLFEITDKTVIARISQTIPGAAQAITKTVTNKALKNVELFKLDIPSAALVKSKEVKDAVRAFSRGKNGISKNANLTKADPTKITKASAIAANVMNIGSLVVGQYYMAEISAKLNTINNTVNKISDFQDREFKGNILSLISRAGEISQFRSEIMENDELRNRKLAVLEDLKGEATKLLGQVNITITEIIEKNPVPSYQEYQKIVEDFNILVEYQNVLIAVLEEISKLTYLLGKGHISSDMSYSVYYNFLEQAVHTRNALEEWHEVRVKALKIDLDKNRMSKSGPEGFFSAIPVAVINDKYDKWKYRELKQGLVQKINTQTQANLKALNTPKEIYDEDVEIVIKDGKYYFLHETSGTK